MAAIIIIIIFVLGYLAIAFEQVIKLNKAASALITGVFCWIVYILQSPSGNIVNEELLKSTGEIASILFFLVGAMTIVELIDSHDGFAIITQKIKIISKPKLLITVSLLTFLLSSVLNNLTTAIVIISLSSKLLNKKEDRLLFAGITIISANAGGVWSPIGDVTTTMLWFGGQITATNIIKALLLPSLTVCICPTLILAHKFKGEKINALVVTKYTTKQRREGEIILCFGIAFLILVPLFKTLTHLPPFMGMLLALGFMWIITSVIHKNKDSKIAEKYNVTQALQKVDTPSILFFLGILLAISALQYLGILKELANVLKSSIKNDYFIGVLLGLFSSVIDNVPLVAASQGMYDLSMYPTDHSFWQFLALTTGTGGSIIIIGSAAGVAAMGVEQIDFIWYVKKISWLALLGFISGIFVFLLQNVLFL